MRVGKSLIGKGKMADSHSTPTHGRPLPLPKIGNQDRLRVVHAAVRSLRRSRRSDGVLASALAGIAVELLAPRALSDLILMILDSGRAATMTDLARLVRRRKANVIATVRALEKAGRVTRLGQRWIRTEEPSP